jgi:hypothetical protein
MPASGHQDLEHQKTFHLHGELCDILENYHCNILWRAHCETAVNKGRTLPSNQQPRNNGSNQRFLCGLSQGNNRGSHVLFAVCFVTVFSLWSVHGLYSSDVSWQAVQLRGQFQLRVSWRWVAEKSPEELVDGQWEPVWSAGGPGPW